MTNFSKLAIAIAAVVLSLPSSDASAQDFRSGYNFGTGVSQSFYVPGLRGLNNFNGRRGGVYRNFGLGFIGGGVLERSENLPYFAKFPPVYYSGIVKRPYGISPYAVPPGITPTEMQAAPVVAEKVVNPYFEQEVSVEEPVVEEKVDEPASNKTTWLANPYLEWHVQN